MDAHQLGTAPHHRLFQRLSCRALQCFTGLFKLLSIIPGFFHGIPSFRSLFDGLPGWRSAN